MILDLYKFYLDNKDTLGGPRVQFKNFLYLVDKKTQTSLERLKETGYNLLVSCYILAYGLPKCKVCHKKMTGLLRNNSIPDTCSNSCRSIYGKRLKQTAAHGVLKATEAKPLTLKSLRKLRDLFSTFREQVPGGQESTFIEWLAQNVSTRPMLSYYSFFVKSVPISNQRRGNLRLHMLDSQDPLFLKCRVCKSPLVGYSDLCSSKCQDKELDLLESARVKEDDLRRREKIRELHERLSALEDILLSKGDPRRVHLSKTFPGKVVVKCPSCGEKRVSTFEYIARYGCRCSRVEKIAKTNTHSHDFFLQRVEASTKVSSRIELLGTYSNAATSIRVRCTSCSHTWSSLPGNILAGHGCPHCSREEVKAKNKLLYGVEYSVQRPEIQKKIRRTMTRRYGVRHALQNRQIFNKMVDSSYSYHAYKLGKRTLKVQGFEPHALSYLLQAGFKPSDICAGEDEQIPSIPYVFRGKELIYHPDIFIPRKNLIIEVKSDYTYKTKRDLNMAKKKGVLAAGYKFKFLVMNPDGSRSLCL